MVNRIKIGFDAKRYFHNKTGLGNYGRWLIDGFIHKSNYDCHLFAPKIQSNFDQRKTKLITPSTFFNRLFPSLWRSIHVSKELPQYQLQIYHGTSNELPQGIHKVNNLKTVVTIHDVINLVYPENYTKIDRWVYQKKLEYATQYADVIVTVSEATKQDILTFYPIDENKIKVIGLSRNPFTEITDYSHVPNNDFLLCVSSFGKRKNIPQLIDAHAQISDAPTLIITGGKGDNEAAIVLSAAKNPNCKLITNPTDAQLDGLYKNCLFAIYPSLYEGFGIPIIEAFQHHKTVITSNVSSMPEVGGEAALYFNPKDQKSIQEAIINALDHKTRKELVSKIPHQLEKFNSENLLHQYDLLYKSLIKPSERN